MINNFNYTRALCRNTIAVAMAMAATPAELESILYEMVGSYAKLRTLVKKVQPYFHPGDRDYDNFALYVQALYSEAEGKERQEALTGLLQEFLDAKSAIQGIPAYISNIQIQTTYWKPYLILFKCQFGGLRAFGKLFILSNEEVRNKYQTELNVNKYVLSPILKDTPNIPRLLHVDESVPVAPFYEFAKSHVLDKHRKWLQYSIAKSPANGVLLLYEDVGENTLKTYLPALAEEDLQLQKTLFQLFATIQLLHNHGICHGDLFVKTNVMLKKLDEPRQLAYTVYDQQYILNVSWLLTVIDFDLSTKNISACEDYKIVIESIQEVLKITFPETLEKAIKLLGAPFRISVGGGYKKK